MVKRVLVLGAGGLSGGLAVKKMLGSAELEVIGAARTEQSAKAVAEKTGAKCIVCDLTKPNAAASAMEGIDVLVVLSSATPKMNYFKMMGQLCRKLCCQTMTMGHAIEYQPGGYPKEVDWEGAKAAIDAAKAAGVKHVIQVGSMGGTNPNHFLNTMGHGNILLWKRKAELYLINSGLDYTIIHPGGLLPHFGKKEVVKGGERELLVGIDDAMLANPTETRCIPREDLAEVVLQCALEPEAIGKTFDLASKDPIKCADNNKVWDKNLKTLLGSLDGKTYDWKTLKHEILDQ